MADTVSALNDVERQLSDVLARLVVEEEQTRVRLNSITEDRKRVESTLRHLKPDLFLKSNSGKAHGSLLPKNKSGQTYNPAINEAVRQVMDAAERDLDSHQITREITSILEHKYTVSYVQNSINCLVDEGELLYVGRRKGGKKLFRKARIDG